MKTTRWHCRPITPDTIADFFGLHEACACDCFCTAWHVPTWEEWERRTAGDNRALREELFGDGSFDGYLLYDAGTPIGWCQVGVRDRLPKLVAQYGLEPGPSAWAVTCLLIGEGSRRQGAAGAMIDAVVENLAAKGVARVQAFPRRGESLPDDEAWTGTESLYRRRGFVLVRETPSGPVWERRLG